MNRNTYRPAKAFRVFLIAALIAGFTLNATPTPVAHAATLTVNSTADVVDANPGNGTCATAGSVCTLRAAIQEANALSGDDTILLPSGTYTLTIAGAGEDAAATGDLDITSNLTINGAGASTTIIDAGGIDRVLDVIGSTVNISGVRISGGNPGGFAGGGGIRNNDGTLTLTGSIISNNMAYNCGGITSGVSLTISHGIVDNNIATTGIGGGICTTGTLTLTNSTISGNTAAGNGGGIVTTVFASFALETLNNVTITNNHADSDNNGFGSGGGVDISSASITLNLKNSILAGNTDAGSAPDCFGTLASQGYNLIQNTAGCTIAGDTTGNLTGVAPLLGLLQDNGGPTFTHALLPGSSAIDAGNPITPGSGGNACETTDQRGIVRPLGAFCDIGAYESPFTRVQFSNSAFTVNENGGIATITVTLGAALTQTVAVTYTTSNGTALAGSDYLTATGTLTFTPGVITQTFGVTIIDDTFNEPNETVTLTLSNPANSALGTPASAMLTILDNDFGVYLPLILK